MFELVFIFPELLELPLNFPIPFLEFLGYVTAFLQRNFKINSLRARTSASKLIKQPKISKSGLPSEKARKPKSDRNLEISEISELVFIFPELLESPLNFSIPFLRFLGYVTAFLLRKLKIHSLRARPSLIKLIT